MKCYAREEVRGSLTARNDQALDSTLVLVRRDPTVRLQQVGDKVPTTVLDALSMRCLGQSKLLLFHSLALHFGWNQILDGGNKPRPEVDRANECTDGDRIKEQRYQWTESNAL